MKNREKCNVMLSDKILCFIEFQCHSMGLAFFTSKPLSEQKGDSWHGVPFEHNAGWPHDEGDNIQMLRFEYGEYLPVTDNMINSPYSVQDLNAGNAAWLKVPHKSELKPLFAGVTMRDFARAIQAGGGAILIEMEPVLGDDD